MMSKSSPVPFLFLYFKIFGVLYFSCSLGRVLYSVAVKVLVRVYSKAEDLFLSNVCVGAFEFCVYVYVPLKTVCAFF